MKLRNKETGEIVEINKIGLVWNKYGMPTEIGQYDSLAKLNEEWEDAPQEPLIKDEKIRKTVRAWAELCGIDRCHFEHNDGSFASGWYGISLPTSKHGEDIESGVYTIAELCGTPPEPLEPTFVDLDERIKEKEEE